jgi:ribosome recycling factor
MSEIGSVTSDTRARMQRTLEAFEQNIGMVRTGRANPSVLSRIQVEYYGTSTPLNQLATVSSPDARTLLITPFDKGAVKDIERAIRESDLGFNPNNRGDNIFISVPSLNDERRRALVKQVKNMAEEARVALRNTRRDANDELKEYKKENLLTEDDVKLGETEVQKLTDDFVTQIEQRVKAKEEDIMAV